MSDFLGARLPSRKSPREPAGTPAAPSRGDPPRRASPVPSLTSLRALDWFVFFLAVVQTGFGAFVSVYLTTQKWTQTDIGLVLTVGAFVGLVGQIPGGAIVDAARSQRWVAAVAVAAVGVSAFAQLSGLTVETLRHYHQVGLLLPAEVDGRTGYRRYGLRQLPSARALSKASSKSSTRKNRRRPLPGLALWGLVNEGCSWAPHSWRQSKTVPSVSSICPK